MILNSDEKKAVREVQSLKAFILRNKEQEDNFKELYKNVQNMLNNRYMELTDDECVSAIQWLKKYYPISVKKDRRKYSSSRQDILDRLLND